MSLTVTAKGDFELPDAGTFYGKCTAVVDIGVQEKVYNGKTSLVNKIMLAFALHDVKTKTGNEVVVWKNYTASLSSKSALYKHLTSWRGRPFTNEEKEGFDISNVLSKYALISIAHEKGDDGTDYAFISSVAKPMKGSPEFMCEMLPILFTLDDPTNISDLPDWIADKIKINNGQPVSNNDPEIIDYHDGDPF